MDEYGKVEKDEHIFDILTKLYDFNDTDVEVLSAQDLLKFYQGWQKITPNDDIYTFVEFFMKNHSEGHFIIDECPILKIRTSGAGKMVICKVFQNYSFQNYIFVQLTTIIS